MPVVALTQQVCHTTGGQGDPPTSQAALSTRQPAAGPTALHFQMWSEAVLPTVPVPLLPLLPLHVLLLAPLSWNEEPR